MSEVRAFMAIAYRDLLKFLRDPVRIFSTLVFPLVFIIVLGGAFAPMVDSVFDFRTFVFVGVLAQTMWQSAALGLVSLIEDRENDFSQAIFVAPISRYSIVFGKILGESLVALAQGLSILLLGLLIGMRYNATQLLTLAPAAFIICIFGGSFGLLIMSSIRTQRAAQQIFPFLILPQFFLAGVFNRMQDLDGPLALASRLSPLRYAVDLVRGVFYAPYPEAEYQDAVVATPLHNLVVIAVLFSLFLFVGTGLFVRRERNR